MPSRFQIPKSPSVEQQRKLTLRQEEVTKSFVQAGPMVGNVRTPTFSDAPFGGAPSTPEGYSVPVARRAFSGKTSPSLARLRTALEEHKQQLGSNASKQGRGAFTKEMERRHQRKNKKIMKAMEDDMFYIAPKKERSGTDEILASRISPHLKHHRSRASLVVDEGDMTFDDNPFSEDEDEEEEQMEAFQMKMMTQEGPVSFLASTLARPGDRVARKSVFGEDAVKLFPSMERVQRRTFKDRIKDSLMEAAVALGETEDLEKTKAKEEEEAKRTEEERQQVELERKRPILGLTRHLHAIAPTRTDDLSSLADHYIFLSRQQREKEANRIKDYLEESATRLTDFPDPSHCTFEDYILLCRAFHRQTIGGCLRVLQIPRAGWIFSQRALDAPAARRLDQHHTGGLELIDVFHFFFPGINTARLHQLIASYHQKHDELLSIGSGLPMLDRLSTESINAYARLFARVDGPKQKGRIGAEDFAKLAGGSEFVPEGDIYGMFLRGCKEESSDDESDEEEEKVEEGEETEAAGSQEDETVGAERTIEPEDGEGEGIGPSFTTALVSLPNGSTGSKARRRSSATTGLGTSAPSSPSSVVPESGASSSVGTAVPTASRKSSTASSRESIVSGGSGATATPRSRTTSTTNTIASSTADGTEQQQERLPQTEPKEAKEKRKYMDFEAFVATIHVFPKEVKEVSLDWMHSS